MEEAEAVLLFNHLRPLLTTMSEEIEAIGIQQDGSLVVVLIKSSEEICEQIVSRIHEIEPCVEINFLIGGKIVPAGH